MLGAYLKRGANLMFLAQQHRYVPSAELRYALEESISSGVRDWTTLKNRMKDEVSRYVYNKTKRSPMVLTVIQEA